MYKILIIERKSGKVEKEIEGGNSERIAKKVERGANINLNHDKYYTSIKEDK